MALAAGNVRVEACQAGGEGGGIYTASSLNFTSSIGNGQRITYLNNNAALSGGALMANGQSALVHVSDGHALSIVNNTAQLDGGGVGMVGGSVFRLVDEGCAGECKPNWRGNNICNPTCLTRGCNWSVFSPTYLELLYKSNLS